MIVTWTGDYLQMIIISYLKPYTGLSQKFCNILVWISLQLVYHVTEVLQRVEGTQCGSSIGLVSVLILCA